MGILFNLTRNLVVNSASATFKIAKAAKDSVQKEVDIAHLEDLLEKEKEWKEINEHLSSEEKEKLEKTTRAISIVEQAKRNAKDNNELRRLKHKYGL